MRNLNDEIKRIEREFEDSTAHINLCEFESCSACVDYFSYNKNLKTLKEVRELIEDRLKDYGTKINIIDVQKIDEQFIEDNLLAKSNIAEIIDAVIKERVENLIKYKNEIRGLLKELLGEEK